MFYGPEWERLRQMLLAGHDGTHVEIAPVGYEFPVAEDGYDLNWLTVRAKVTTNGARWGGSAPCLLTWELAGLCEWLAAQASSVEPAEAALDFLEPELEFCVVERTDSALTLRVITRHGLAGLWGTRPEDDERSVEVTLSREAVAQAAADLALEAKAFPQR